MSKSMEQEEKIQGNSSPKQEKKESKREKTGRRIEWFHLNERYMSICRYAIFVIVAAILIYILVSNLKGTFKFIGHMVGVLSPFLIGLLIAYFLSPLVELLDKGMGPHIMKGKYPVVSKIIAIIISYVLVLGFITVAFVFVVPEVVQSIRELTRRIPEMYRLIIAQVDRLAKYFPDINAKQLNEQMTKSIPDLAGYGTDVMSSLLSFIYSWSVSLIKMLINLILAIFISIYMIYSKHKFIYQGKRLVFALFSEEKGEAVCETGKECNDIFSAFLISKSIDSLIIGILCFILMSILRLPYAVLLSVIVGITNMIPYFGPFIGAVPGVLIFLCTDWELALVFAIMILVLQQFDGIILGPRLLGQSTGLSPIWVIFGVTVGGAYFGVIGMFMGVPVVAVIAHLCNKFISSRLEGRCIKALENEEEQA